MKGKCVLAHIEEVGAVGVLQTTCPVCGCPGNEDSVLGELGRLLWIRCRACGMDYHVDADAAFDRAVGQEASDEQA